MLTLRQHSLTKKAADADQALVRLGFYCTVYKELFQSPQKQLSSVQFIPHF
jgi:hypothetical protein